MKATALTTPSGKPVSNFSFGTMQFGGKADADQSRKMYDASRAAGINFFDTAYVYTEGRSEALLGQFAKNERDDLVIATKCASVGGSGAATSAPSLKKAARALVWTRWIYSTSINGTMTRRWKNPSRPWQNCARQVCSATSAFQTSPHGKR